MSAHSAQALTFSFNYAPNTDSRALAGFVRAGNLWSSLLADNVTLNIDIGFEALDPGVLGEAMSEQNWYSYTNVYNALLNDRTSTDDFTAVSNLPKGSAFNLLLNRTSNNPNGAGSSKPYLDNDGDANNTTIFMTNANAKALGLLTNNNSVTDASIAFSSLFSWDFEPNDGIAAGSYDFVGAAAHEIGHALGFISGVDILDYNSSNPYYRDDQLPYVSTMDLFRFSKSSISRGKGVIDWTANKTDKYFSINGGTDIANFSTGATYGDKQQASHWKDNQGLGIMDPTATPGELLKISQKDKQLLDAIGWNLSPASTSPSITNTPSSVRSSISTPSSQLAATSVPEPSVLTGLMVLGAGFLWRQNKCTSDKLKR